MTRRKRSRKTRLAVASVDGDVRAAMSTPEPPALRVLSALRTPHALALLFVASVVPYLRTWGFGFVHLDDTRFIVDGEWFFKNWRNIPRIFTSDVWGFFGEESSLYRPLLLLPRFVEMRLFHTSPGPYHILNTGLHFAAVAMLFLLLRALMGEVARPMVWAALFALHPAHVPVVAWIEGYNNSMLAVFILAALLLALRAVQTGARPLAISSGGLFLLALLTKENAVSAPILCAVLCSLHLRRSRVSPAGLTVIPWMIGAWSVALLTWCVLRWNAIPSTRELDPGYIGASIGQNYPGLLLYWGKIFFPFNLSTLPILRDSSLVPGLAAAAIYAALYAASDREVRAVLAYGLSWFLLLISPSLLVLSGGPSSGTIYREDRLYQASIGPLLAFAVASHAWTARHPRAALRWATALALAALCTGQLRMGSYEDGLAFYSEAVSTSPHLAQAHTHLADRYVERQDFARAWQEYQRALTLNPSSPMLNNNVGLLLSRMGDLTRAELHFHNEITLNPRFPKAHFNLGNLLARREEFSAAASSFERVLALHPEDRDLVVTTLLALRYCYERLGQTERVQGIVRELESNGARLVPLPSTAAQSGS